MKLMFDATILANGAQKNSGRSGIFFTAYQIVGQFIKQKDIELSFYCDPKQQYFLKKLKEFKNIPIYPKMTIFDKWNANLRRKKHYYKLEGNKKLKSLFHYLLFCEKVVFTLPNLLMRKIYSFLYSIKPDAYFSPCEAVPTKINTLPSVKKYILLHDVIPLVFPEYFNIEKGTGWFNKLISYIKENQDVAYFANSEYTKQDFLKYVPELKSDQITTTLLACSEDFHPCSKEETLKSLKKYHLPTDKRYVFSLCSLAPHKNLIRAVKTFVEFIKKNKIEDMVFILGGGHYEDFIDKLDKEINDLGNYKEKIIKAGYIDDEDLAPLYSGAEWFVYTSQYEGFGLPPLEAMACGCPVITSNNSSLPEVVGDAGLMIDWDSDEQHIRAYEDYYFHPELREQNHQKGLERAKQFSWDKTVDLMVKEMQK